jgi:nucleoside-diphosphate kinase
MTVMTVMNSCLIPVSCFLVPTIARRSFHSGSSTTSASTFNWAPLALAAAGITGFGIYQNTQTVQAAEVPLTGVPGTRHERTFIAIKPDGVQRGLIGEIVQRFERKGYKLVAVRVVVPTEGFAAQHYDDLKARPFFPGLVKYFSSGPVFAMVWEGKNVISEGRKIVRNHSSSSSSTCFRSVLLSFLVLFEINIFHIHLSSPRLLQKIGATNPTQSEPGSIRGDLCIEVGRNIIHGSDSPDAAKHEIALWFKPEQVANFDYSNVAWIYEKP